MDAAELDRRARTFDGWIPPDLVSWLLEHGYHDEVRLQARDGDWFCAQAWARLLADQGRRVEALEVLTPYIETGWLQAARVVSELLEAWGRADEAIACLRPHAESGEQPALDYFGRLLARNGRAGEAYTLLLPHISDWLLAETLVEVTVGLGRDEEIAALLAAGIESGHCTCNRPSCGGRTSEPWNALDLLAAVRERQGRIDEAIALLHTREVTSVNGRDELADLLARHDRIDELREYAATGFHEDAIRCLAELLEERGDVTGAIEVYQPHVADGSPHAAVELALLLARHGRGGEAIDVLRTLPSSHGGEEDWVVATLCELYIDQGRAEDGLAYLDDLDARSGSKDLDFNRLRTRFLVSCGRTEQVIEEARTRPDADIRPPAQNLTEPLSSAEQPAEAPVVPEPDLAVNRRALAAHLLELGRIKDAVAVLHQTRCAQDLPAHDSTRSSGCPPL